MRETVFFNREQLKIIRRYWRIYQAFFKYGTRVFAFIVSIFILSGIVFWGSNSLSTQLKTELIPNGEEQIENYKKKQETIAAFSGIQAKILNGQLSISPNGNFLSQNNLLSSNGMILPNSIVLSSADKALLNQKDKGKYNDEKFLHSFFNTFIQRPSKTSFFWEKNPKFLTISGTLYETFALECLNGPTQYSFVCKFYLEEFLDHFFFYDLNPKQSIKEEENASSIEPIEELKNIYTTVKNKTDYQKRFCQGLIHHGQYGGLLDDRYMEIFRDCGNEYYNQFILLRDFSALAKAITLGYVDTKVYPDSILNQYKVLSLQQLMYKQILASTDIKPLMQSYLSFLREILIRENTKKIEIIDTFTKTFTYRFHINILSPYLKDEQSKMNKEDRTAFHGQLLSLNHGDKIANFIGLQDQITIGETTQTTWSQLEETSIDLEKLFKSSYLPAHFALTKLQKGNENTLIIEGVDKKTSLSLEARLKYENLQLLVEKVKINKNQKLTEYINAIIKNDKLSLNKVLSLMQENKSIAEQTQTLDLRLCSQLKAKYTKNLINCSDTEAKIIFEKPNSDQKITYTFWLEKGKLKALQISDKVLETKILKLIDFKQIDATTSFYIISSLIGYEPKDDKSELSMKEHLLVSDKFIKYFSSTPEKVVSEEGEIKVYFTIENIKFIGTYDIIKSELNPIAIDFWTERRPVIIQNLSLIFRDDQVSNLNAFLLDPIKYLEDMNPALVKKYFPKKAGQQ